MHHTNPFRRAHQSRQEQPPSNPDTFAPPPGPPPSYHQPTGSDSASAFAPPPGPPPAHQQAPVAKTGDQFVPPSGPPPSWSSKKDDSAVEPPAYHPWMEVPDNALLPPPPALGYDTSPTANATRESADSAREWCRANPLYAPRRLSPGEMDSIARGYVSLSKAPSLNATITSKRGGTHLVQCRSACNDSILLTNLPLYTPQMQPQAHQARTIYFEIRVVKMGGSGNAYSQEADTGIALGFVAAPYPSWRLPGWERASLGVHGDDGRRYVNDNMGGKDFTTSFKPGEVIGIGMKFKTANHRPGGLDIEVFLTRDGEKASSWDLFEERDASDEGGDVFGLGGTHDLLGAVGFFGRVEFEVRFHRDEWLYRP